MQNLGGVHGECGMFKQFESDRHIMLLIVIASKKAYPYHTTANKTLHIHSEIGLLLSPLHSLTY